MKKLIAAALALGLMSVAPAFAQTSDPASTDQTAAQPDASTVAAPKKHAKKHPKKHAKKKVKAKAAAPADDGSAAPDAGTAN